MGAGRVPSPSAGTGHVNGFSDGVYCVVDAVCIVVVTREATEPPPAASASCRRTAGIGVSGEGGFDAASDVPVAAGSERVTPITPDTAFVLKELVVVVDALLERSTGALDAAGTLVALLCTLTWTPGRCCRSPRWLKSQEVEAASETRGSAL